MFLQIVGMTMHEGCNMKKISDLHKTWMKNPEYRKEFVALEKESAEAARIDSILVLEHGTLNHRQRKAY